MILYDHEDLLDALRDALWIYRQLMCDADQYRVLVDDPEFQAALNLLDKDEPMHDEYNAGAMHTFIRGLDLIENVVLGDDADSILDRIKEE